jgi:hypothetical protein
VVATAAENRLNISAQPAPDDIFGKDTSARIKLSERLVFPLYKLSAFCAPGTSKGAIP